MSKFNLIRRLEGEGNASGSEPKSIEEQKESDEGSQIESGFSYTEEVEDIESEDEELAELNQITEEEKNFYLILAFVIIGAAIVLLVIAASVLFLRRKYIQRKIREEKEEFERGGISDKKKKSKSKIEENVMYLNEKFDNSG